jgi:hypothetical protein
LTLERRIKRLEARFGVGGDLASTSEDGPVVTEEQMATIIAAIQAARLAGRHLMIGGECLPEPEEPPSELSLYEQLLWLHMEGRTPDPIA